MNNYLEGWFSLKWFYPSQILSYEWGNEYILYLIIILPVFLITRKLIRKRNSFKVTIPDVDLKSYKYSSLRFLPNILITICTLFLLIALARPQKSNEKIERWSEGIDIILAMDISESMQIEDFKPNRLNSAKNVAKGFVKGRFQDRIGLVSAAFFKFPNENSLVVDIGTCITYDFIDSKNIYHGGAISPGINMRYKSLNKFTSNLPLLEFDNVEKLIGSSTEESIHIGVYNGIIGEINEYINRLEKKYLKLNVIITGGDSTFLLNKIKNAIFADQDFLAIGLNNILKHNEGH